MASPSLNWNADLDLGLDAKAGVSVAVLGDIEALSTNIPFSYHLWNAPDAITIVSGDKQPGIPGQPLPLPLKVLVTDTLNFPMQEVPVYFEVTGGGGSVSSESIPTGADGYAETYWTPGTEPEEQTVNASIRDAYGETIDEKDFTLLEPFSLEEFSGNNQPGELGQPLPEPIEVIVKDIDGNPYSGATVYFEVDNGGSVSQEEVTTGQDGIASVLWTLGSEDCSQTLTSTAFKSDNTTPLQGSPLNFQSVIDVTILSTYVSSWSDEGIPCPGYDQSGNATMGTQFDCNPDPAGTFWMRTLWDGEGDGTFEGGGNWSSQPMSNINVVDGLATYGVGFCWGRPETVLKFEVKYVSPANVESNTYSMIVPRP